MRKQLLRHIAVWVFPPIIYILMWFIYLTCKKYWHFKGKFPKSSVVVAFWHGELLMAPFVYRKFETKRKISVIISDHFDGEIIARVITLFGMKSIRGSTRKGAAKALIAALNSIKNRGENIGITPDGPKGPRHSISDGVIAIAQKSNAPIIIINCRPSNFWQASSWDRFTIPKPFSRIDFYASEPIYVDSMSKEEAKSYIKDRMLEYAI